MSEISVSGLEKFFGRKSSRFKAIDDVSFTVNEGEMLVLVGPSGCGKTTTLRCVAGLQDPDAGKISFGDQAVFDGTRGVSVPIHRRDIGLVFQSYALWPHMSARRNIEFPLRARKVRASERRERSSAIAKIVDLDDQLLRKRPGQLSGGQQQRIALARALVSNPRVVLFDEPLSNLDVALREQLRSELKRLHQQLGFTGIYVTHDLTEAMALGDRVAAMANGRIEQIDPPAVLFTKPASAHIARLLGFRRLCSVSSGGGQWAGSDCAVTGPLDGLLTGRGSVDLYARPENIELARDRPTQPSRVCVSEGRVAGCQYLGSEYEVTVRFGERQLRLNVPDRNDLQMGDQVYLSVQREALWAYAQSGDAGPAPRDGAPTAEEPVLAHTASKAAQ